MPSPRYTPPPKPPKPPKAIDLPAIPAELWLIATPDGWAHVPSFAFGPGRLIACMSEADAREAAKAHAFMNDVVCDVKRVM